MKRPRPPHQADRQVLGFVGRQTGSKLGPNIRQRLKSLLQNGVSGVLGVVLVRSQHSRYEGYFQLTLSELLSGSCCCTPQLGFTQVKSEVKTPGELQH